MTIEAYRQQYNGMSATQVRGLISSSKEFRYETEKLYTSIFHQKLNKNCGDCWMDAYILIMRTNPEKLKAMQEKIFDLRAGAVLVDPRGDSKKTITHLNITDELALYHLRTHPDCIRMFSVFPENWEELAIQSGIEDEKKNNPQPIPEVKEPVKDEIKPSNDSKPAEATTTPQPKKKAATSKKKTNSKK